jgi:hypothetical protein
VKGVREMKRHIAGKSVRGGVSRNLRALNEASPPAAGHCNDRLFVVTIPTA